MSRNLFGYLRVSRADKNGDTSLSIDAQRAAIMAHATAKGDVIVEWFVDEGISGKNTDRPGFQAMLTALAEKPKHRTAEGIVAAKLDRLSRSIVDFGTILETSKQQKWSVAVLDFELDTRTAVGRMMAGQLIMFAQFERELIGERTSAALQEAKRRGVKLGRPITLPATSERRVLELKGAGLSAARIADQLNTDAVPTGRGGRWYPSTVQRVLARQSPRAQQKVGAA